MPNNIKRNYTLSLRKLCGEGTLICCFNIVINVFHLFVKYIINPMLNNIKRNYTLSLRKLCREGTLVKIKKVLGWIVNSRSLEISLPSAKGSK